MSQQFLIYSHLFTILPAMVLGTLVMMMKKGGTLHKLFGRTFMILMFVTAAISLGIEAGVGFQVLGHFGPIHILSVFALISVPKAYLAAKRGDIKTHRNEMIGLYFGACIVAGIFAIQPGRMLHSMIFA